MFFRWAHVASGISSGGALNTRQTGLHFVSRAFLTRNYITNFVFDMLTYIS